MSSAPTTYDREILIAEYTLGLLNSHESAQAQQLLGEDARAAAVALKWESNFLDLVDLLAPVDPGPQSLQRLQTTLGHTTKRPPNPTSSKPASGTNQASASPVAQPPAQGAGRIAASLPNGEHETLSVATVLRTRDKSAEPLQSHAAVPAPEKKKPVSMPGPKATTASALQATKIEPTIKHVLEAGPEPDRTFKPVRVPEPESVRVPERALERPPQREPSREPEPIARAKKGNIWIWRIASGVFASIAIVLGLMPGEPAAPPITVIEVAPTRAAIMQAPGQSSTPGWVVTIDPQGNVLMNPQVRSDVPADASVQLWTYNKTMTQPRSLGLIDINQPVTVPATLMGEIGPDQLFEMTQEPAGGSPTASPSGPILFIGRVVTFGRSAVNPPPVDGLTPGQ